MSNNKYSVEKTVQIIIGLMKAHNVRRVIASPGSTNVCLVYSLQNDPFFEVYSCVDERSAAYMACGMTAETGEPVALTCTEATASRNYMSGLTEAYYRKLPVLAITATNNITLVGQNYPQMIDRSRQPNDIIKKSVFIPFLTDDSKKIKGYINMLNDTMTELIRHGGGPVHIEYETRYSGDYSVQELPDVNVTKRIMPYQNFPVLSPGRIAIYVGAHKRWSDQLVQVVDRFCEKYDAVVLCDHISNYNGKYDVHYTLLTSQHKYDYPCASIDTLIYIGEVSSAYNKNLHINKVWRVSPDGEFRNMLQRFGGSLEYVFEMEECSFFSYYEELTNAVLKNNNLKDWRENLTFLRNLIPELPFSNLWIAQTLSKALPNGSRLYLAIENTLRSWNFFETDKSIECYCNTGGFGIDGGVSSMMGATLASPDKLFFGITGDLAFFYDMNVLGNRHIGKNFRLLVINNGLGQQFKNPGYAASHLGQDVNKYVAAEGHFGHKSDALLKHYSTDLGYIYLSASDKESFLSNVDQFVDTEINRSIVFEVFTDTQDETEALSTIQNLMMSKTSKLRTAAKEVFGSQGIKVIKKILP